VQACKRLMKGAFRDQLEQAVKFETQVFAERVRSDETKEAFRAFFGEAQARIPSAVNAPIELLLHFQGSRMRLHSPRLSAEVETRGFHARIRRPHSSVTRLTSLDVSILWVVGTAHRAKQRYTAHGGDYSRKPHGR
jgi:hypothetical protein